MLVAALLYVWLQRVELTMINGTQTLPVNDLTSAYAATGSGYRLRLAFLIRSDARGGRIIR